jgi:ATP-dependent Clp protease ATP-binding subunit ClpX
MMALSLDRKTPVLDKTITPSYLVKQLDQYVIGQDDAKKIVAVAVYLHFRKIATSRRADSRITKSNVLLVGPTGTGKTLLCETLSRILGVPFATAEATALAQSRFVNEEIEAVLQRLVEKAGGDIAKAENGIVFIDEIDKLKATDRQPRSVSGESVQHALLKIMEGAPVKLGSTQYIDTTNILFVCGGAFIGLDEIMSQSNSYGYISTSVGDNKKIMERLNARIKPTDLFSFGLIPEFTGRLPIIASFEDLSRDMLVRIMTEPKDSLYAQFREIFSNEGVELVVEPRVFEQVAELAMEYKTGARSLRGIFEEMITPILYLVPDNPDIRKVTVASLFNDPKFARKERES